MTVFLFCKRVPPPLAALLLAVTCLCASAQAQSQGADSSVDNRPPVIELEELAEAVADSTQVFTVQIAEETELRDATLYYRRNGQQPYTAVSMTPLGASGFYTVSISTDPADIRPIEYYVQARDASGNRTVSGFAFDPYSRRLSPARVARVEPAVVEQPAPTVITAAPSEPFYKKRWFQITLGVVAVGVLASSLETDGDDTRVAPVTITLE